MVTIEQAAYTRSAIVQRIEAFLSGQAAAEPFRRWLEAYNWDDEAPQGSQQVRQALGLLELSFHEYDDGTLALADVREQLAEVARSLR